MLWTYQNLRQSRECFNAFQDYAEFYFLFDYGFFVFLFNRNDFEIVTMDIIILVVLAFLCTAVAVLGFILNEFYTDFREFRNKHDFNNF